MAFFRESNEIMYMKLLSNCYVLLHLFLSKDRSFWNLTYMFGYRKNNRSNVETWASTGQSSMQVPSWIGLFEWAPSSRSRLCNQRWKQLYRRPSPLLTGVDGSPCVESTAQTLWRFWVGQAEHWTWMFSVSFLLQDSEIFLISKWCCNVMVFFRQPCESSKLRMKIRVWRDSLH